ncbi:MAG: ABC transporter ATP-binding protein [Candidatus Lokiarchaeota archaeon]|nr:ABC transporter ATP-binding protein [Candidatus Lokiarchaeota archaeon]
MKKVRMIKYTKPYLIMIFIAIGLLYAQANFNLTLPDYLSKIVNVGIQQGGVEDAVPEAIQEIEMNRTLLFLTPENQTDVLNAYKLVNNGTTEANQYIDKYPVLINQSVYVLTHTDSATITHLNPIMARALLNVAFVELLMANDTLLNSTNTLLGLSLPGNGTDLFEYFETNPMGPYSKMVIMAVVTSQLNALGDKFIIQAATQVVRAEYEALGMDLNQLQLNYLLYYGGLMILLTILSMACTIAVSYLSAKIATGIARDMRRDIFKKIEKFSSAEFDSFSTASLITRSTNDITQVQMAVMMIVRMVFYAPIIGIGGVIHAIELAPTMWWIIAMAVGVLLGLILVVFYIALPKFKSIQRLVDRLNLVARESLTGIMVVRAFNKQQYEEGRFDKANIDLTKVSLFINRVMVIMMPLMMMLMNVLTIVIIWVGSHEIANANLQVGDMIAFMQYAIQVAFAFLMLSLMFIILPRASVSISRIAEVLKTDIVIQDAENPKLFTEPFKGTIEFRNVSFRYAGAPEDALHNISFTAHSGEVTAFIGPTGSGKSTLINLVPRFYDVTSGAILIDGIDVREVSQHDLRDKIGFVPQKDVLFSGTVESNLLFADENASEEELKYAIQTAQITDFVDAKSEGIATEIAQGGTNVSGGQKQRFAIARALVKKAPINILDDSFSNLDFKTDVALRKALRKSISASTVLIVTQRVSTIKNADQIIVINEGRIVGKGTHVELMETCPIYKDIAISQLKLEELL